LFGVHRRSFVVIFTAVDDASPVPMLRGMARLRRPPFGRHGRKLVVALCGWELIALTGRTPLPTVSQMATRRPVLGALLLVLLAHHWFVEQYEIEVILDEIGSHA
jgi:hypothetical protein